MGDRNNPIKFGPEWLRNLARERSAGSSASNNQNSGAASGAGEGAAAGAAAGSSTSASANATNALPKVQLAKLRYGREEMLALYDRTSEAPQELKYIDVLYQPRGKPPVALNNTFEDEMRETSRIGPPMLSLGERFGVGRGMGRGINIEGRGRARLPFVRQQSAGRGWHLGNPRMPGYSGGADDDSSQALRSWSNNSNGGNVTARNSGEQTEWTQNKMFRSKRPGTNTNWRQATRDDGEEWRASDTNRSRSTQQEKWERDWGDRPNQDKQQSWNTNRRTWVGDTQNNDDNLPEWAVDNAEACGGTFDSSGAFHGYSNDDTNLPKNSEPAYTLTRSHTHGSFARSKTVEEGSEEWWASEKAKKLSPKRFDASDIKFKKPSSGNPEGNPSTSFNTKPTISKEDTSMPKVQDKPEASAVAPEPPENNSNSLEDSFKKKNVRFVESKTFDALMRSDINLEEANDERGNFQSVMITPNNSLRQKHQNIVSSVNTNTTRQNRKPGILQLLQTARRQSSVESDLSKKHQTSEDKTVEEFMDLTLEEKSILTNLTPSEERTLMKPPTSVMSSGMSTVVSQMSNPTMQLRMTSPVHGNQGLTMNNSNIPAPGIHSAAGIQTQAVQSAGMNNFALGQAMGMPIQGVPPPVLPNQGMGNPGMGGPGMQSGGQGIPGFQSSGAMPGMSMPGVSNNPLFLGQSTNNSSLHSSSDIPMPSHGNQTNMFPMHGLQHSGSQTAFGSSMYGNIMQPSPTSSSQNSQSLAEQWYYEDPKKNIQGPFSSKDMYSWYRAGFFSPSLMVRRACDGIMRPLGSYGPMVPFAQMDMMSSFPMPGSYERSPGPHDAMTSSQQTLGMDVMNMNMADTNSMESMQYGTVGLMRNPPFGQQQMVDSLWSQSSQSPDLLWMQRLNARNETRVNNLPMFFWDQQPSAITSNSLLPEEIAKEMKTEDQILAQLRASQNFNAPQNIPFLNEQPVVNTTSTSKPEDAFTAVVNNTPNLEELQKLIREDTLKDAPTAIETNIENQEIQSNAEKTQKVEAVTLDSNNFTSQQLVQNKVVNDSKPTKQPKNETDKSAKNKENNNTKAKNKKSKEDKKDDLTELKNTEENTSKTEKRSQETSPSKNKKDEKLNKKELEKEKKEWLKDGFTIVKGSEKNTSKDNKKKAEDVKAAEEAERKRKEEERLALEEEKKKKQAEALKKQQEQLQQQQQRQASEAIIKKAPWSAVANQAIQATTKDGLTLAEIQRLEREKKLEQMKEQQQMMQIIAQQQAAALAREQEMQAGLGWAKKKGNNVNNPGQSLAEIQAEARKQAAIAAAAATQTVEEAQVPPPPQVNHVPWGNTQNGGGFWDPQPSQPQKPQESPKIEQSKKQKKITLNLPTKKETSPAAEFETWCTTVLASWSTKIDVPTFVGFLKDIESPYEVKDYVKCYLGESKDTSDFARQFLERRSKLLRVGMVTPSDDLCSPAMAVNPRTTSGSDFQEVKGKVKKTKKNKMLKVDARILGFSVTAAEDRINVGDIDTA